MRENVVETLKGSVGEGDCFSVSGSSSICQSGQASSICQSGQAFPIGNAFSGGQGRHRPENRQKVVHLRRHSPIAAVAYMRGP
ncbi:hypothetical protein MCOR26_003339 [Pyricularia oryzae]|nr:hypothetical protein MCOR26_003339 [Pyricularia oryzae]